VNAQSPRPAKNGQHPLAVILGIQNPVISDSEFAFFRESNPYGLFLGRRNMRDPQTARALCQRFREAVGREDAPVLTDQEGGRVSHLDAAAWPRAAKWRRTPCASRLLPWLR
jgi:beta-N-acetylhexosaminidase